MGQGQRGRNIAEGRQSIGNERAVSTSGQRKILKANAYE